MDADQHEKRAALIERLVPDMETAPILTIDGILNAMPLFPLAHVAFCLAVALHHPTMVDERVATIDREQARALYGAGTWNAVAEKWGFDIFDPVLENPRFYLFCADLLTDSFSPGGLDLSALETDGFATAVADACDQLDLPDVSAAAVSILGHLTDCMT